MHTRTFHALALGLALALPTAGLAQDQSLTGTVGATFDTRFTVTTTEGQFLVTAPDGESLPAVGQIVRLTGSQSDNTFAATTIETVATGSTIAASGTLGDFGFVQTLTRADKDDDDIYGQLPDGTWLEVEYDDGRIEEIKASEGMGLPQSVVDRFLPAAVRTHPRMGDLARIVEIEIDSDGEIEVEGFRSDGMEVELEFDRSGNLTKSKVERDDRRGPDVETARARLTEEGYTDLGWMNRGGKHIDVIARNPFGEMVKVRLDESARIDRERSMR